MKPPVRPAVRCFSAFALAFLAACSAADITPPPVAVVDGDQPIAYDGKPGSTGSSAKHGLIISRVLINAAGIGTLEVRTGTYDNFNAVGQPDGFIEKVQYKVMSAAGKQLSSGNVGYTNKPNTVSINLGSFDQTSYVIVQANVRGVGGDLKRNDVVRDSSDLFFNPDLGMLGGGDVGALPIKIGYGEEPAQYNPGTEVQANVSTRFQVTFDNPTIGLPTVGAVVACAVRVYDLNANSAEITPPALPYAWHTLAGTQASSPPGTTWAASLPIIITPDGRADCRFNLTLPGVGTKKRVVVTAVTVSPSDYDLTNNTVFADYDIVPYQPNIPPVEGIAVGTAYELSVFEGPTKTSMGNLVGIVDQTVNMTGLSALVVNSANPAGTFTLRIKMSTAKRGLTSIDLTDLTPIADAVWTADLATLFAANGSCLNSDNVSVSGRQFSETRDGTGTPANAGHAVNQICVSTDPDGKLRLKVQFIWGGATTFAASAVPYKEYLRFGVTLDFSNRTELLGSNSNLRLQESRADNFGRYLCTPGMACAITRLMQETDSP